MAQIHSLPWGAAGHCAMFLQNITQWPDVMKDFVSRQTVLFIAQAFDELNDKILKEARASARYKTRGAFPFRPGSLPEPFISEFL